MLVCKPFVAKLVVALAFPLNKLWKTKRWHIIDIMIRCALLYNLSIISYRACQLGILVSWDLMVNCEHLLPHSLRFIFGQLLSWELTFFFLLLLFVFPFFLENFQGCGIFCLFNYFYNIFVVLYCAFYIIY